MKILILIILMSVSLYSFAFEEVKIIKNNSVSVATGTLHKFGQSKHNKNKPQNICLMHQNVISSATLAFINKTTDQPCGELYTGYYAYIPHFIPKEVIANRLYTNKQCKTDISVPIVKLHNKQSFIKKYKNNSIFNTTIEYNKITKKSKNNIKQDINFTEEIRSYFFKKSGISILKVELKADSHTIKTILLKEQNSNVEELVTLYKISEYFNIGSSDIIDIFFVIDGVVHIVIKSIGDYGESNNKHYIYQNSTLKLLSTTNETIC